MANAIVISLGSIAEVDGQPTKQRISFTVVFAGVDVPGNFNQQTLETVYTLGDSVTTLGLGIRSSIQTFATSQGFTVANGATELPTYQTI